MAKAGDECVAASGLILRSGTEFHFLFLPRGIEGSEQVERLALRRLQVTLARGPAHAVVPLAIDGEPLRMQLPVEFTVAPRPLRLIAPA